MVDKFIIELEGQLEDRNVTFEVDDVARTWLAEKGYDPKMGARPMARLIQDRIKKALAEELLFGRLENCGLVRISVQDDDLTFSIETEEVADSV